MVHLSYFIDFAVIMEAYLCFHQVSFFFLLLLATTIQKTQHDCNLWQSCFRRVFIRTLLYLQPHQLQAYGVKNVFHIFSLHLLFPFTLNEMSKKIHEKMNIHLLFWTEQDQPFPPNI